MESHSIVLLLPWSLLCYRWVINTSTSLADMVWAKTDGDGVKLVVPSETVPEALASRKSALKWPFSVKPFVWKWKLEISCAMALVDVQVRFTDTSNVLPDTKSVTEMVVFKLAETSFFPTWKLALRVEPWAASNSVLVQLLNWSIKMSAPLVVCLLTVFRKPSTDTEVSIQPSGLKLSKKAKADRPWNLNTVVLPEAAAWALGALVVKAKATRDNRRTNRQQVTRAIFMRRLLSYGSRRTSLASTDLGSCLDYYIPIVNT